VATKPSPNKQRGGKEGIRKKISGVIVSPHGKGKGKSYLLCREVKVIIILEAGVEKTGKIHLHP